VAKETPKRGWWVASGTGCGDRPSFGDRLIELLAGLAGLRLAAPGERSDVTISDASTGPESASPDPVLTAREAEVLSLLAEGASNKEIARKLGISVHTAKFHVGRIIDKLDATGGTDAVAHAARLGVLHL